MARIRSIKPAFFRHGRLYEAEKESGFPLRVAFAGLWTAADREGRFRWEPRELKLDCLPYDDLDFEAVLDALHAGGFVEKYETDGRVYGYIPSWLDHQHVNQRETESDLPKPSEEMHVRARADTGTHIKNRGEGNGREGKGTVKGTRQETRPSDRFEEFWKAYPKRDGANPKKPARKKFDDAVKQGHDPGEIIAGAERYRAFMLAKGQEGTQYVAQAVTWLRQARWEDELPSAINGAGATDDDYPRIKRMLDTEAERGEWPFVNTPKATIAPEHIARWQAERA